MHNVYDADTEDNIDHPIHHMKTLGKGHSYSTQSLISSVNDQPSKYIISDSEITPQDISACNAPSSQVNNQDDQVAVTEVVSGDNVGSGELGTQHDRNLSDVIEQIGVSNAHIINAQKNDPSLLPIISYLDNGQLPSSQKAAREVLLKHTDFALLDGILYHSKIMKSRRSKTLNHYQMVLPHDLVLQVLKIYHDSPLGCHGGIQDTLDKVKEHFYCPKLTTLVYDYVKSCSFCQKRKLTHNTIKSKITSYPLPSQPFEVWEIDLYGRLPPTPDGHTYVFTAVDMFSKYLFALPIKNKDALTVANAIFRLFTTFGVCNTLVSDQGTEFIAKVTQELCASLQVKQEFTPSFVHHCLGACERTHSTLAEKLTPYVSNSRNSWKNFLPAIVFAMNTSVNATLGFSPYEIIFGQRPKFPLTNPLLNFDTLHKGIQMYMKEHAEKLSVIRTIAKENALKRSNKMVDTENSNTKDVLLKEGDYVFLQIEATGEGQKFQNRFDGPYVIEKLLSPHMVQLKDPRTNKLLSQIHRDRLKIAYVREPTPSNYFSVSKCVQPKSYKSSATQTQVDRNPVVRRSDRKRQKPIRYRDDAHADPDDLQSFSVSSDSDGYHKIKRVLGQRDSKYLVQIVGEPADNAVWVASTALNAKAKRAVNINPPPTL